MREKTKRSYTFYQLQAKMFPNTILERLNERLCESFGLDNPWQHRVQTEEMDPRTGLIELAGKRDLAQTLRLIEEFYTDEGYKSSRLKPAMIETKREGRKYRISVCTADNVTIFVSPIEL